MLPSKCHWGIATDRTGTAGRTAAPSGRVEPADGWSGSTRIEASLTVPTDRYVGSSVRVVAAVPSNDAASTARKSGASIGLAGLRPWDPTDPGNAAMASRAVSARLATTRGRRTLGGTLPEIRDSGADVCGPVHRSEV